LAAINLVETRMGRIRGDSSAGAQGPMQFLPTTWASCCRGDINDPHDAINGAADYLVSRGAPADMAKAVFGYNPSRGYVTAVQTYASVMDADVRAFYGYAAWQVFVSSTAGDVRLPVGYSATAPIDAASYLSEHPGDRAP
jgi:membrane-bound lytic murein transglycosylase B